MRDTEEMVELDFIFSPSLRFMVWKYDDVQQTFVQSGIVEEPPMEIILHKGKDRRLKIWGVNFTAPANETKEYDFAMPFTAAIQYGKFFAGESKTGDRIWMIIGKGITGVEYAYVDGAYITKNADYKWGEEFGTSSDIPEGIPLQVKYENTDSEDKIINFNIELRLPEE